MASCALQGAATVSQRLAAREHIAASAAHAPAAAAPRHALPPLPRRCRRAPLWGRKTGFRLDRTTFPMRACRAGATVFGERSAGEPHFVAKQGAPASDPCPKQHGRLAAVPKQCVLGGGEWTHAATTPRAALIADARWRIRACTSAAPRPGARLTSQFISVMTSSVAQRWANEEEKSGSRVTIPRSIGRQNRVRRPRGKKERMTSALENVSQNELKCSVVTSQIALQKSSSGSPC